MRTNRKIRKLAIGLIIVIAVLCVTFLLASEFLLNTVVRDLLLESFREADYSYALHLGHLDFDLTANRLTCDSIAVIAADSTLLITMGPSFLSGADWTQFSSQEALKDAEFGSQRIALSFPGSQYTVSCKQLDVSAPDSAISFRDVSLFPSEGDEKFFAVRNFRRTRFLVNIPEGVVRGVHCLKAFDSKYRARSITLRDAFIDILINKNKRAEPPSAEPLRPQEALVSIDAPLTIDSVSLIDARLNYAERFPHNTRAALLTWDSIAAIATKISNQHAEDTMALDARGLFQGNAVMKVAVTLPMTTPDASFRYSGSLTHLPLQDLNPFLVIADQVRLRKGILYRATFDVDVSGNFASGNVRALYEDLTIAVVDKQSGSEDGLTDQLASLIANTVNLRRTNILDGSEPLKVGKIQYPIKRDEEFIQIIWFALRSGLADLVGF
jgi:hypothetical protein